MPSASLLWMMFFLFDVESVGEASLNAATIHGNLLLTDSYFINPKAISFIADRIQIRNHALFNSIYSEGTFRLTNAEILGNFECLNFSTFLCPEGISFNANSMKVSEGANFESTYSDGEFNLANAKINGQLRLSHAWFQHDRDFTLNLQEIQLSNGLFLDRNFRIKGILCLDYAKVKQLVDSKECWPSKGMLRIEGFEYDSFAGSSTPISSKDRLEWLSLMPEHEPDDEGKKVFFPQPHEQLARVLRQTGKPSDARKILIAKHNRHLEFTKSSEKPNIKKWFSIKWQQFLGLSVAYGYEPWRAIIFLLILWSYGSIIFMYADRFGTIQPSNPRVYLNTGVEPPSDFKNWPERYPFFQAHAYSFDSLIPFVNLHQENYWLPVTSHPWGSLVRVYLWVHIIGGWIFATLGAVSLTGIVRKDE